jgi:hypothetical protein
MHLVKGHSCCLNILAHPIKRDEKFGPTSKLDIYEQKCKLSKRSNRHISFPLLARFFSRLLYNFGLNDSISDPVPLSTGNVTAASSQAVTRITILYPIVGATIIISALGFLFLTVCNQNKDANNFEEEEPGA